MNEDYLIDEHFTVSDFNPAVIYRVEYLERYKVLYYYGSDVVAPTATHTFIAKVNEIGTVQWAKKYDFKPTLYGFDLGQGNVSVYVIVSLDTLYQIIRIQSSDGTIQKRLEVQGLKSDYYSSVISVPKGNYPMR